MNAERWHQIDKILQDALERDPADRAVFLDRACAGDASMPAAVESLIGHSSSGSLLDSRESARTLPSGSTISHYRITEKIGEGATGVVYKAVDINLERTVALKFLAPDTLLDLKTRIRFIREAKAAASVDHPNVCAIHEIDETEGHTFLALTFVEGQTVRQRMSHRPLKVEEALNIAIQTAEGIQAAHEKGIVHR